MPRDHALGVRRTAVLVVLGALLVAAVLVPRLAGAQQGADPNVAAREGAFTAPFEEPTIGPGAGYPRVKTEDDCIERKAPGQGDNPTPAQTNPTSGVQTPAQGDPARQPGSTHGFIDCKPAAGGLNILPNGKVLYWDNLAGTENVEASIASEYGVVGLNDQSRLLDPKRRTWEDPSPLDGGARSKQPIEPLIPSEVFRTHESSNDASLFCSDHNFLADGRIVDTGGTKYTNDPGNDQSKYGSTELYGVENTRIYDPATNVWKQSGSMHKGRWYGSLTTLGDGKQFEVSGLRKLIKPVNRSGEDLNVQENLDRQRNGYAPGYGFQEGQNERTTETFDPNKWDPKVDRKTGAMGAWTLNPDSARRSLPLFPRMHLLPNGDVYYDPVGQSFDPFGQAYDQSTWNFAATYNTQKQKWTTLGQPGLDPQGLPLDGANPGFRGSTFSVMLPLKPDSRGRYDKADFLVGGGIPGGAVLASPGTYFTVRNSDIRTIDTTKLGPGAKASQVENQPVSTGSAALSTRVTGQMNATTSPTFGRWYGQGTQLPTGQVLATSGADRDEVVSPGTDIPVKFAEIFEPNQKDPESGRMGRWVKLATATRPRTYHNTAALMPDGRVLVSGHAIISNNYFRNFTIAPGVTDPNGRGSNPAAGPEDDGARTDPRFGIGRDPSSEIYSPPYMFCPGKQAKVTSVTKSASDPRRLQVKVDVPASSIQSVVLSRYTTTTHVVDNDQRTVELKVLSRRGDTLTVQDAPDGNVLPRGPYMMFANRNVGGCVKPSVAKTVFAGRAGLLRVKKAQATRRRGPRFTG